MGCGEVGGAVVAPQAAAGGGDGRSAAGFVAKAGIWAWRDQRWQGRARQDRERADPERPDQARQGRR
jgi:hypothetical protein